MLNYSSEPGKLSEGSGSRSHSPITMNAGRIHPLIIPRDHQEEVPG